MEIAFLQARYFKVPTAPRRIDLLVLHAAVVKEAADRAEWLMKYCANNDRVASWHYAIDCDSVTQSVKETDIAFHAPGVNHKSLGFEFATVGEDTKEGWEDSYSSRMLNLGAWLAAGACHRHKIDPYYVDAAGLIEGRRGITTHAQVSLAFKKSTHTDPGPHFPMDLFLAKIKARLEAGNFEA